MDTILKPEKIIFYCDKVTGKCLIRVTDNDCTTVKQYGSLPPLCSISDLYIDVIETVEPTDDSNFVFCVGNGSIWTLSGDDGNISLVCETESYDCSYDDIDEFLRTVFGVV